MDLPEGNVLQHRQRHRTVDLLPADQGQDLLFGEEVGQVILTAPKESDVKVRREVLPRWTIRDGVKVGHLIAGEFEHDFAPGMRARIWGYNGGTPGPTIEGVEGDRIRVYVTNRLPEPTTVHWHGVHVPFAMDGVGGLTQPAIAPGEAFAYEFDARPAGTRWYHTHVEEHRQMDAGLENARWKSLSGGIAALHVGSRSEVEA